MVRTHAVAAWLLFGLTWLPLFGWFTPTALPAMLFIWGVPFLGCFGRIRAFWPAAVATGAILVLAFLRSEFVVYLLAGKGIGAAFATKYWFAPIFIWFVAWAVICGFQALREDQAPRVINWFGWLVLALAVVQAIESVSGMALRKVLNNSFYGGAHPELLIVGMANCNAFLTMLFWPMALHYVERRRYGPLAIVAFAVIAGAIASDTNAHLLAMAGGLAVFLAVRAWPRALHRLPPWRLVGGLTAAAVLAFPVIIYAMVESGLAQKIKTELLPSWAARIDIWTFATQRALEKPWFGWGYEASRNWDPIIPDHPHSMSLQAWLELGVPGLILLAVLWLTVFWWLGPKESFAAARDEGLMELGAVAAEDTVPQSALQRAMPYMLAAGAAYYTVNTISFGLWRAWYYCLGAVVVGVTILVLKSVDTHIQLRNKL